MARKKRKRCNLPDQAADAIRKTLSKGKLSIVYRDPATLKLWDKNPRRNDAAAKKLAEIIKVHGFKEPVTMRKEDGVVYKGNTRVKAARLLGLPEIPVMVVSYPKKQDAIDEAVADNRASEWAEHDEDLLCDVLGSERDVVEVARVTGFEQGVIGELRQPWSEPEEVSPQEPPEPRISRCPKCGHEWEE